MMTEHKPPIHYRAVRMVKGGMTQVHVARELDIDVTAIRRWLAATDQDRHSRNAQVKAESQS